MRHRQGGADGREETVFVGAGPRSFLAGAFEPVHVGRRSADIVNDPLESRMPGVAGRFVHQRPAGTPGHAPSLVHGDGAKGAAAVAAAVAGQGEANGIEGAHRATCRIVRVDVLCERQRVYPVDLAGLQRRGRRVVNEPAQINRLGQSAGCHGILIVGKETEHPQKQPLGRIGIGGIGQRGKSGQADRIGGRRGCGVAEAADRPPVRAIAQSRCQ